MGAVAQTAAAAIKCPAGDPIEDVRPGRGPGCRCKIANTTLSRDTDPSSLKLFCAGEPGPRTGHTACPIWKRHRKKWLEDQHRAMARDIKRSTPRSEQ